MRQKRWKQRRSSLTDHLSFWKSWMAPWSALFTRKESSGNLHLISTRIRLSSRKLRRLIRFATKNGVTDTTRIVEDYISKSNISYNEYSAAWIERGYCQSSAAYAPTHIELCMFYRYSPIYEWCSQKSRVVLDYPEVHQRTVTHHCSDKN